MANIPRIWRNKIRSGPYSRGSNAVYKRAGKYMISESPAGMERPEKKESQERRRKGT
jgi:hypothetical protein